MSMNKRFIIGLVVLIAILISSIAVVSAADVDVVRDFDNTTIYHTVKSDSSSQAVYGLENSAKLIGRDKVNHTEPISTMANTEVKVDDGYYTYQNLVDENGIQLNPTDKVKFNYNRTLTAVYKFTPYMFAEIDVLDFHGHSASSATYPAMKTASDSITKTFKEYTDVEEGYKPLYILDLDTNTKYQPGDKFTITYQDVVNTGITKMIKTFQYVYAKDIVIENIIIENRTIYNDTIINRDIFNDTIINRTIYNDTTINRIFYNDTYENRTIYNDIYENRTIYNDIIVNRTIENIIEINKTIEVPIYVNKTIENIIEKNVTIEVPVYVNKTIENITYVTKIIEIPIYVIKNETINEPVKQVVNNQNITQNNETKIVKVLNNNTTKTNTTTNNINDENNTSTPTSNNIKTIKMKETGNPIAWIVLFLFIFLLVTFVIKDKD